MCSISFFPTNSLLLLFPSLLPTPPLSSPLPDFSPLPFANDLIVNYMGDRYTTTIAKALAKRKVITFLSLASMLATTYIIGNHSNSSYDCSLPSFFIYLFFSSSFFSKYYRTKRMQSNWAFAPHYLFDTP